MIRHTNTTRVDRVKAGVRGLAMVAGVTALAGACPLMTVGCSSPRAGGIPKPQYPPPPADDGGTDEGIPKPRTTPPKTGPNPGGEGGSG